MAQMRIMHIDDEPDIREIVASSLALDSEMTVRSFASGMEGVAGASEWSPNLVLLDLMMPKVDGVATLALLRQDLRTVTAHIVFMTGRAQERDVEFLMSLGA